MFDLVGLQRHRQKSVLQTVVVKDIGEPRRDRRAEARVVEPPHRMLARTAASEIVARDQNRRALVARLVQHEILVLAAVRITPPINKQPSLKPRPYHSLEKLLRNNLIGIDISPIQRRNHPSKIFKFLHSDLSYFSLILGAGVTPAQGGAEPTVGSALNKVNFTDSPTPAHRRNAPQSPPPPPSPDSPGASARLCLDAPRSCDSKCWRIVRPAAARRDS